MEETAPHPRAGRQGAEDPGRGQVIEFFSLWQLSRWHFNTALATEAGRLQDAFRSARNAKQWAGVQAGEVVLFDRHDATGKLP